MLICPQISKKSQYNFFAIKSCFVEKKGKTLLLLRYNVDPCSTLRWSHLSFFLFLWVLFWMPSHKIDTKKEGAGKTQTLVITWLEKIITIKYIILAIEIETGMLTPPGYQNRKNNKQKRTFCTQLKLKNKFYSGLIWGYTRWTFAVMKMKIINLSAASCSVIHFDAILMRLFSKIIQFWCKN